MNTFNGQEYDGRDETSVIAAEYVLRLLPEDERRRLEGLAQNDPVLRSEIAKWEARFALMADELPRVEPPPSILLAIQRDIQKAPVRSSKRSRSLWDSAPFWRGFSFASVAASLVMAVILIRSDQPETPAAPDKLVMTLNLTNGSAAFVAAFDPARKQMILVPASMLREPARVPELWLIPPGGKPISLGIVHANGPQSMIMPDELAALTSAQASMVITLEPPGGAPGGVATGPIVAQGKFSKV